MVDEPWGLLACWLWTCGEVDEEVEPVGIAQEAQRTHTAPYSRRDAYCHPYCMIIVCQVHCFVHLSIPHPRPNTATRRCRPPSAKQAIRETSTTRPASAIPCRGSHEPARYPTDGSPRWAPRQVAADDRRSRQGFHRACWSAGLQGSPTSGCWPATSTAVTVNTPTAADRTVINPAPKTAAGRSVEYRCFVYKKRSEKGVFSVLSALQVGKRRSWPTRHAVALSACCLEVEARQLHQALISTKNLQH